MKKVIDRIYSPEYRGDAADMGVHRDNGEPNPCRAGCLGPCPSVGLAGGRTFGDRNG